MWTRDFNYFEEVSLLNLLQYKYKMTTKYDRFVFKVLNDQSYHKPQTCLFFVFVVLLK